MPSVPVIKHRNKISPIVENRQDKCQNLELLLYKFSSGQTDDERQRLWGEAAKLGNRILGAGSSLLDHLGRRQLAQLESLRELGLFPATVTATVDWRFFIGGSVGKIWNISIQLHPLYGIPFAPASAVKGMLVHYAREERKPEEQRGQIFGKDVGETGGPDRPGRVVFLDAFCQSGASRYFDEDVINKHFKGYYESDTPAAPADYSEPEPVKFMAIAGGVNFAFRYAAPDNGLRETVFEWLKDCLTNYGLGAKTRVGYGRFGNIQYCPH